LSMLTTWGFPFPKPQSRPVQVDFQVGIESVFFASPAAFRFYT
jgi:hypothetical protein